MFCFVFHCFLYRLPFKRQRLPKLHLICPWAGDVIQPLLTVSRYKQGSVSLSQCSPTIEVTNMQATPTDPCPYTTIAERANVYLKRAVCCPWFMLHIFWDLCLLYKRQRSLQFGGGLAAEPGLHLSKEQLLHYIGPPVWFWRQLPFYPTSGWKKDLRKKEAGGYSRFLLLIFVRVEKESSHSFGSAILQLLSTVQLTLFDISETWPGSVSNAKMHLSKVSETVLTLLL